MAIYTNEAGTIKDLSSKIDLGNGFEINGIDFLGCYEWETDLKQHQSNSPSYSNGVIVQLLYTLDNYKFFIFVPKTPANSNAGSRSSGSTTNVVIRICEGLTKHQNYTSDNYYAIKIDMCLPTGGSAGFMISNAGTYAFDLSRNCFCFHPQSLASNNPVDVEIFGIR